MITVPMPPGQVRTFIGQTRDPRILSVQLFGPDGPTSKTLRSVGDGAIVATLPPDAVDAYPYYLACVPGAPRAAAVLDSATGAEVRRLGLLNDCSGTYLQRHRTVSNDLMEQRTAGRGRDGSVFRITRLADGLTFGLLVPQLTDDISAVYETGSVLVVPDGDGISAIMPRGTSVIVARGQRDMEGQLPAPPRMTGATADGAALVAMDADRTTVVDRRTRRVVAALPYAGLPEPDVRSTTIDEDTLGVISVGGGRRVYSDYGLPDLALRHRFVLPDPVAVVPDTKAGVSVRRDRVAGMNGGRTALWDRRSGDLLAVWVPRTRDPGRFQNRADLNLRPGTDEAVFYGHGGIDLWNLRTNDPVASFPAPDNRDAGQVIFTSDGERMATVGMDNSVTLWDVDQRTAIAKPFVLPAFGIVLGFTADGNVIFSRPSTPGTDDVFTIEFWNPLTGRAEGDMRTLTALDSGPFGPELYDGRSMQLLGRDGALPARVPITVQGWQDSLCRLVDRPFTEQERAVLPAGVDDDRPCG